MAAVTLPLKPIAGCPVARFAAPAAPAAPAASGAPAAPTAPTAPAAATAATRRRRAGGAAEAGDPARGARRQAVADVRRSLVLDAARAAFHDLGLERASLREIARRAGYTPGAIYRYFASKEEVYAALLFESLERLNAAVAGARPAAAPRRGASASASRPGDPASALSSSSRPRAPPAPAGPRAEARAEVRARATAFFEFYRAHPRDLDLGFYLFHGVRPRGLTPALNEPLNARLRDALAPVYAGLVALGASADDALADTTALFAQIVGVLVLGHSGRIRMFLQEPRVLFDRHLDALLARTGPPRRARSPEAAAGGGASAAKTRREAAQ